MNVGLYIRVSTDEQANEGYSISAQQEKLKAFALSQTWKVVDTYVDAGISAKDTNRPELQRLMKDIEGGAIDCLLVYRLDRLTRTVSDLHDILKFLEEHNCKFKSATEVYDTTTAMGRLFLTLVAALAQWERENIGERVRFGQIEKARQGFYSAAAPLGYTKSEEGTLIIDEEKAKIIRLMYSKIVNEGYSIRRLSDYLNSSSHQPIRGYKWHIRSILSILKNPAYYGAIKWLDEVHEGCHEPIISKEEFDKLQTILFDRRLVKLRDIKSVHLFQTKLICPACENRLTSERSQYQRKKDNGVTVHLQYRCQSCALDKRPSVVVSERRVETGLMDFMLNYRINEIPKNDGIDEVAQLEDELNQRLKALERRREKYQKAWANDLMEDDEFTKLMAETKGERENIEQELRKLPPKKSLTNDIEKTIELLNAFKMSWEHLNAEEKRNFIQTFIRGISFKKDGINVIVTDVDFY